MSLLSRCGVPSRSQVYLLSFFIFHSCERDGEKTQKIPKVSADCKIPPSYYCEWETLELKGILWLIARPSNISRFWGCELGGRTRKGIQSFSICLLRCNGAWARLRFTSVICDPMSKNIFSVPWFSLQAPRFQKLQTVVRPLILSGGKKENQINRIRSPHVRERGCLFLALARTT